MQVHATAPEPLHASKGGVLCIQGYGADIRVDAGMLRVRAVVGGRLKEQRFPRVDRPRLTRLVVLGRAGAITLDALAWLSGIEATFLHLGSDGKILAASGSPGPDIPALRRIQAKAADSPVGIQVSRYLIGQKVAGHRRVLGAAGLGDQAEAASAIEAALHSVERASTQEGIRLAEAQAASAYWRSLAAIEIRWARADLSRVPPHWLTIGTRSSALTGQPRVATTAAHAVWNYLYRLLEFESRIACIGSGLDPGIGILHADQRARDSLALDVMEAVRPEVDAYVLRLIADRAFGRREFVELPNGNARLAAPMARTLSETVLSWWKAVAPIAEKVARMLADSSTRPLSVPTRLTGEARRRGRDSIRVRALRPRPVLNPGQAPSACRSCGLVLSDAGRRYCEECLPERRAESSAEYFAAGLAGLALARAEGRDTSASGTGRWKMGATNAERQLAIRNWSPPEDQPTDPDWYRQEVLPGLVDIPLHRIMSATGLSLRYCSLIRRGLAVPHPRHWDTLRGVVAPAAL